jgi:hypothetical protein
LTPCTRMRSANHFFCVVLMIAYGFTIVPLSKDLHFTTVVVHAILASFFRCTSDSFVRGWYKNKSSMV